jgi:glucosamine 6-phosphate synthetase-like amidotransferase/phosphosugar isomerase protein
MCGIFGVVARQDQYPSAYKLTRNLMLATQVRGSDATGVAGFSEDAQIYGKNAVPAHNFVHTNTFQLLKVAKPTLTIGHCRLATHGSETKNINNHPFKAGNLYLAHNGVITNYFSLEAQMQLWRKTECDSEVLLRIIATEKEDIVKGIQKIFNKVQGSYACAVIDAHEQQLWLFRNNGSPLTIAFNPKRKVLAFASTRPIFNEAVSHTPYKKDHWTMTDLPSYQAIGLSLIDLERIKPKGTK